MERHLHYKYCAVNISSFIFFEWCLINKRISAVITFSVCCVNDVKRMHQHLSASGIVENAVGICCDRITVFQMVYMGAFQQRKVMYSKTHLAPKKKETQL